MKKTFLLLLIIFLTNFYAQNILWMKRLNLLQNEYGDRISKDSYENIIIAGSSENIAGTSSDILVVKCDPSGDTLWHRCFNAGQMATATDLITDPTDELIVAYRAVDSEIPGLIKYSPNGDTLWTKRFPEMSMVSFSAITLDSHKNIFVCGWHNNYGIIVKHDSCGNQIWSRRYYNFVGGAPDFTDIVLDSAENIFISGIIFSNPDSNPFFVAKFNNSGDLTWVRTYTTGRMYAHGTQIRLDNVGDIVVAGYDGDGYNSYDALIRKYSPTGTLIWHNMLNFSPIDGASGIAIDESNSIFLSGECGTWGAFDYFLVKYSPTGESLWTRFYDGGYDDDLYGVIVDSLNNPIISGRSSNGTDYDILMIKYSGSSGIEEFTNNFNLINQDYKVKFATIKTQDGKINLEINRPDKYKIILYNSIGSIVKIIHQGYLSKGLHQFNLNRLQNGVYFLHIDNGKNKSSRKIIYTAR